MYISILEECRLDLSLYTQCIMPVPEINLGYQYRGGGGRGGPKASLLCNNYDVYDNDMSVVICSHNCTSKALKSN